MEFKKLIELKRKIYKVDDLTSKQREQIEEIFDEYIKDYTKINEIPSFPVYREPFITPLFNDGPYNPYIITCKDNSWYL